MAVITYTPGACEALLLGQRQMFGANAPVDLVSTIGLIQALQDETNRRGIEIEPLMDRSGHIKQVRYFWRPPVAVGEVSDTFACDAGTAQPYLEDVITMSMHSHLALRINEVDIRRLCTAYSDYVRLGGARSGNTQGVQSALSVMREVYEVISAGFDAMRQDMNIKLNDKFVTLLGNWLSPDGGVTPVTTKSYVMRNANGGFAGSPVLDGFSRMRQDMRKTTLNGNPIIVGNGLFELVNEALNYGCCNAGGTDFGQMASQAGYRFYADDYTGTALGNANSVLAWKPGMAHLLHYNRNVGSFASQIGTRLRGVIADPSIPDFFYDLSIVPNECGEYYDVYLDKDYDLFVAPDNLFKAGDYRTGVNGTFRFTATEQTLTF